MIRKRLKHVSISGLKNHRRTELAVPQLLAVAGPNGAGKSSLRQAIEILVLGYSPQLGKKLEYTRSILTPGRERMTLAMSFDDGFGIERRIGDSMEIEVQPAKNEKKLEQFQERINAETGSFLLSFDIGAFLELSAEKRRAYLLGVLPRDLVELDEQIFRTWLGYEAAEDVIQKAIETLWMDHVLENQSIADGLAAAIDHTNKRKNEAEFARQQQDTISRAADRDAIESAQFELDPERMPLLQAQLADLQRQIGELQERKSVAERSQSRARQLDHDRQVAEQRISQVTRDLELIDAELAQPLLTDAEYADLEETLRRAEAKARATREMIQYRNDRLRDILAKGIELNTKLNALDGRDTCPTCGGAAELGLLREFLQEERKVLDARRTELTADLNAATQEEAGFVERVHSARKAVAAAAETRATRRVSESRRSVAKSQLDMYQGQLEAIANAEAPSLFSDTDIEQLAALSVQASDLRYQIEQEQEKLRAAGKAEAARERADKERATLLRVTARAGALKELLGSLQKLRAHVIEQLVGPVEATANEILQAIDPAKVFVFQFEREGRAEFDFGFIENDVFRSYDAASTGEDAFLAVVLVAALIAAVQPAWRVLIVDNAESIDDMRREALMGAIAKLAPKYFDNVILAGCCEFAAVEGWTAREMTDFTAPTRVAAA